MNELLYFVAGCVFSLALYFIQTNRKKKIREKIRDLDLHLQYIQKLRKSSVELNRKAFMWLFAVLFCISASLFLPVFFRMFPLTGSLPLAESLPTPITIILLLGASMISFLEFIIYHDVSNFTRAVERIEKQKKKLNEKLENA